jgi:S-adenosylmethionine:tRNA ribosyltransferase-isomerase
LNYLLNYLIVTKHEGAIASPTAGLHFDEALLTLLKQQGVQVVEVTLHVGQGTFKPIATHSVEEHNIHTEWMEVSQQAASQINVAREEKKKVIACGTTALRAVESAVNSEGRVQAFQGLTNLYIYPGFEFKIIDALITNFHLPKTTLLVLVSALAGRETILKAYKEAIQEGYRFYSYGDAMLIL